MRLQRLNAPDHPEYGAQALLPTSVGHFLVTVWTERASSVERFDDDRWTSGVYSFGSLEALAEGLGALGVPVAEAATLAREVSAEWRERWRARESKATWPLFEVWFYGTAAAAVVPLVVLPTDVVNAADRR
jgi:hypothetical protein